MQDHTPDFLLYGAYGYTGRLIVAAAVAGGLRPLLAGRRPEPLAELADEHGLDYRAFALDDAAALDAALSGVPLVLHAAGPFVRTAGPMINACLRTGTHYLDITGEIAAFELAHGHDAAARAAQIMLMPGVGFDVVPTDCMAAFLHQSLPGATDLKLAFAWRKGGISHGTATTMLEGLGRPGAVRRGGTIVPVPPAYDVAEFPFTAERSRRAVTIPWGDVFTAYHTTGIPNVVTYFAAPPAQIRMMRWSRYLGPLLRLPLLKRFLQRRIDAAPAGPSAAQRAAAEAYVYGEVTDAAGRRAAARLRTPEGYDLTVATALRIVRRVRSGDWRPGYQTPAGAYGPDLILEIDGVRRELI